MQYLQFWIQQGEATGIISQNDHTKAFSKIIDLNKEFNIQAQDAIQILFELESRRGFKLISTHNTRCMDHNGLMRNEVNYVLRRV